MNDKKKVWVIELNNDGFFMVDHEGEMQWSPAEEQTVWKMSEFAFNCGADEVRHNYDLRLGLTKFKIEKE